MNLKKIKILSITVIIVVIITIGYSAVFGRLIPYSPVIVGYEQKFFKKATVYYKKGYPLPSFEGIDEFIDENEKIHNLTYKRKVEIILCESDQEKKRITGSSTRAQAFPLFGRVVISRKLQNEALADKRTFGVYLQHELSHSLTSQHLSLLGSLTFPAWLNEGLAVYASNQFGKGGYFTKQEVSEHILQGLFFHPDWWPQPLQHAPAEFKNFKLKDKFHFIYSQFGCIVDDLIHTYGHDRFIVYYHELLENKNNEEVFQNVFGVSFSDYLDEFKNRMVLRIGKNS